MCGFRQLALDKYLPFLPMCPRLGRLLGTIARIKVVYKSAKADLIKVNPHGSDDILDT